MIQLRDKEFDDEDKVLLKNIRQRMEGHVDFPSSSEPEMDRHFQDKAEYFTKIMEVYFLNFLTQWQMHFSFLAKENKVDLQIFFANQHSNRERKETLFL